MAHSEHRRQTHLVEQLFVKHVSAIRGFIEAFVPDFNRAEDVLQECFLTVAAKADAFREGSDFLAWALAIAKFKVLESLHHPWAKVGSLSPEVIEALSADAPMDDLADNSQTLLQECMEELSPRAKEVIEMRYSEACKPAEDRPPAAMDAAVRLRGPLPGTRAVARLHRAKGQATGISLTWTTSGWKTC